MSVIKDFSTAQYTAIISDLHLCEEEPIHPQYPLWKKYKTRQFFFDKTFEEFLVWIQKKAQGEKVELILNGDIFDFDSVTSIPEKPTYRVTWLERRRGLHPQAEKSKYKIEKILNDHEEWVAALRTFLINGNRVIFVIGNHDLELHFPQVQRKILEKLNLPNDAVDNCRFNEWFYISNKDTLIEHGNQYDPFCITQDPINPFVQSFNYIEVRLPFGNLTTRYLINGMGFFNPHADSNFIMSASEYVKFFIVYMLRAQPELMFTWFWGSVVSLWQSFIDRLKPAIRDPLNIEDRIETIALKSNATPRMVREMKELFVAPAASSPFLILRELWLDRAFLVVLVFFIVFELFLIIKNIFALSFFWMFIPMSLFLPFFIFYSRSVSSAVMEAKEPQERILSMTSHIAKVNRIIYGHTHITRHEMIGAIEHLNSGTWSPAFEDVECQKPLDQKTYVWISPSTNSGRESKLYQFKDSKDFEIFSTKKKKSQ